MERPDFVTDAHLEYLDILLESGATHMFLAGYYLVRDFGVSKDESRKILSYWMETFTERNPQ